MIQPAPAQRGVIGEQHGLAKLTTTLEALSQGQTAQTQRDTEMRGQLATQAEALTGLQTWYPRLVGALCGLGLLVLVLAGLVGWQATRPGPELAYVKALGSLDAVLVQTWSTLPKGTQEALSATYIRLGLVAPSQRK